MAKKWYPDRELAHLHHLLNSNQHRAIVANSETLISRFPLDMRVYNIIGMAYFALGSLSKALDINDRAIVKNPNFAQGFFNRGVILSAQGKIEEAKKSYEKTLSINPNHFDALNNLANLVKKLGDLNAAKQLYEAALVKDETNINLLINYGLFLASLDDFLNAKKFFKAALNIEPSNSIALCKLGNIHAICGEFEDAKFCLESSINADPGNAEAFFHLSEMEHFTSQDHKLSIMVKVHEDSKRNSSDKKYICFALAKAYEDMKKYDRAFKFYSEGNALRKREIGYEVQADEKLFKDIKKSNTFPIKPVQVENSLNQCPIFVVGLPRSGTTLIEQILASHSHIFGANELLFANLGIQKHKLLEKKANESSITEFRQFYLESIRRLGVTERFIVDKMPLNFRWIGFLVSALPESKIVHVRRDGVATCWSIYKKLFYGKGNGFDCDLQDIVSYYGLYSDLMQFWRKTYPGRTIEIKYENLVSDPKKQIEDLVSNLGLEMEKECLNFHETNRSVKTASLAQVRVKIFGNSNEAWKPFLPYLEDFVAAIRKIEANESSVSKF